LTELVPSGRVETSIVTVVVPSSFGVTLEGVITSGVGIDVATEVGEVSGMVEEDSVIVVSEGTTGVLDVGVSVGVGVAVLE
jgi:hypothetical protein